MVYLNKYNSPLGEITLASDEKNIIGLWLENQKYFLAEIKKYQEKDLKVFNDMKKWLDSYFKGDNPHIKIPIKFTGTDFRIDVWNELLKIPYGKTISYGEIANNLSKKYKRKTSARAVGNAVGHNPISILVPCHRVIGKDKSLTGYAGGLDKKIKLLELEKIDWWK